MIFPIIWFSYNEVRCFTKTAVILLLRFQIYILSLWQFYYYTRNKTYLIYTWLRLSRRHSKGIAIKNKPLIQAFILYISVWIFPAFSRVTLRTVTQRNYLNSMSDIEVDMYDVNESVSYLWRSSYPLFIKGLHFMRSALLCLKMFSNNTDR